MQGVNLVNGPCILMQLLRLWVRSPLKEALFVDNPALCVALQGCNSIDILGTSPNQTCLKFLDI